MENLHGNTTRIDALSIKEYANIEESDPNIINAVESVLSTRLDENVYCGLINLMNAFSPNTSEDDIQTALVSYIEIIELRFGYYSYLYILNFVYLGILIWTQG